MSMPVLTEMTTACEICGEVACEKDLVYLDDDEADEHDLASGAIVCRDCE